MAVTPTIYTGTFIHTPSLGALEALEHAAVGVDQRGVIAFIAPIAPLWLAPGAEDASAKQAVKEYLLQRADELQLGVFAELLRDESFTAWDLVNAERSGKASWWFPGFIDTHIHASQYPNSGIFGRSTLLDWLHTYTFPLESSLADVNTARNVYQRAVARTLSHGTTTASYFATRDADSTNILADICLSRGQRAFIGRVCMDHPVFNADYYRDVSVEAAVQDTIATISHIDEIDPGHEIVSPIITPRFAPSCTSELFEALGTLAHDRSLPVQTHVSENLSEIALVASLFPSQSSYTAVYDRFNLLTPRTVLAHAVHLTPPERQLVKARRSKISHCPVSNTALASGLCPVRDYLDDAIDVGLGTDVSGGYSSSILVAAREAVMVSRTRVASQQHQQTQPAITTDKAKLTVEECLYLATRGGAGCLNLQDKVGMFRVGMEWDAQLVELPDLSAGNSSPEDEDLAGAGQVEIWGGESWSDRVAKWVFCGDDRNTSRVYVKGRLVHRRRQA